jgi:hypothetical protein
MGYVPDNYDAFESYDHQKPESELHEEKLAKIKATAEEVIFILDNYDIEDNGNLGNRIEAAIEKLSNMIDEI